MPPGSAGPAAGVHRGEELGDVQVEEHGLLDVRCVPAHREDDEARAGMKSRIMSDGSTQGVSRSPTMMSVGTRSARSAPSSSGTVFRFDMTSRARWAHACASCSDT